MPRSRSSAVERFSETGFGRGPGRAWTWLVPLVAAWAVVGFVLATTPPGFRAITDVLFGSPRGPVADAAAYTLGSAASLGLVTLLVMALICGGLESGRKLLRPNGQKR